MKKRNRQKAFLSLILLYSIFLSGCTFLAPAFTFWTESVERKTMTSALYAGESSAANNKAASSAYVSSQNVADPFEDVPEVLRTRFYISQLSGDLLENFFALYQAATRSQQTCSFPKPVNEEEVALLLQVLVDDCPELFHVDKGHLAYTTRNKKVIEANIGYLMSAEEYASALAQCNTIAENLLSELAGLSEAEQEKAIYDYLTAQCTYDKTTTHSGNIFGCLVEKHARCEGVSHAFQWLAEQAGFSCFCISGKPKGAGDAHMWNCIRINGVYADVDVTSDVPDDGEIKRYYGAYNVSNEWIRSKYTLTSASAAFELPGTDGMTQSYYGLINRYVPESNAVLPRITQDLAAVANRTLSTFSVQFETNVDFLTFLYEIEEPDSVVDLFAQAGSPMKTGFRYQYSYLKDYRTITITFHFS